MASYFNVSALMRRGGSCASEQPACRGSTAEDTGPQWGGEEESQAGSGGARLVCALTKRLGSGVHSMEVGQFLGSHKHLQSPPCIGWILQDTSPLKVVEAVVQLSAAEGRGHLGRGTSG